MDENVEQELMEMEKALAEPEEANNTTESKEEESEEESKETEETKEEEETTEEEPEEDEEAPRNPQVPYKKFKAEREKRKELESTLSSLKADIEAIKNSTSGKEQKDEIEKLAEEFGVDPNFAKRLAENIKGSIKSPITEEEIELLRETKHEKEQDAKFDKEFNELAEVNPEAKEYKKKLKELAFTTKYSGKNFKPLYYIFNKEIQANATVKTKTAETATPKKTDKTVIDYETLSEEEAVKTLNPDKFLEWVEYQAKK
jgi:hypothetical protein